MTSKIAIFLALCFCFNTQSLAQTLESENISQESIASSIERQIIIPEDIISVKIKNVPNLSRDYIIDTAGEVELPLIGKVDAAGQKLEAFANMLEVLYEKDYLVKPQITVNILGIRKNTDLLTSTNETINSPASIKPEREWIEPVPIQTALPSAEAEKDPYAPKLNPTPKPVPVLVTKIGDVEIIEDIPFDEWEQGVAEPDPIP